MRSLRFAAWSMLMATSLVNVTGCAHMPRSPRAVGDNAPVYSVAEIRYVPPRDATTYHGQSRRGGEIMVYTDREHAPRLPF